MAMLIKQFTTKRRYAFYCEDGTCLLPKKKPKRHKCNINSKKASAEILSKCAGRPHMKLYCGQMVLWRSDGTKLFTDISKADLDTPWEDGFKGKVRD